MRGLSRVDCGGLNLQYSVYPPWSSRAFLLDHTKDPPLFFANVLKSTRQLPLVLPTPLGSLWSFGIGSGYEWVRHLQTYRLPVFPHGVPVYPTSHMPNRALSSWLPVSTAARALQNRFFFLPRL